MVVRSVAYARADLGIRDARASTRVKKCDNKMVGTSVRQRCMMRHLRVDDFRGVALYKFGGKDTDMPSTVRVS